jgi:hypothetical protein
MGEGKGSELAPPAAGPFWSDRLLTAAFLLLLGSVAGLVSFLPFRDGKGWVLLIALIAGAVLWVSEHLEAKYRSAPRWNPFPGYLAPLAVVSLATLAVCFPTLHSYFSGDEFAYIRLFQHPSWGQFLRLFHGDLSQGVLGWNPQELRPFYGLSFMLSYSLWGIRPLGYHLSAILVHILNSLMVFLIVKRVAPDESGRAGFAGLLFAMLPVNSWNVAWANGYLTEGIPTLIYIFSFLCFISFLSTDRSRYLIVSILAFAAGLLTKETVLTLPVMLASYDLFHWWVAEPLGSARNEPSGRNAWVRRLLTYAPFGLLLIGYLELRRLALPSFLREDGWGSHLHETVTSPAGFWLHFRHAAIRFWDLQAFNFQHLLLPFPSVSLGLVLGVLAVWVVSFFRRRSECRKSMAAIVYFGLLWYLISNAPLMLTYLDGHHLYIPSAGLSVAAAFLAFPGGTELRERAGFMRWLGAAAVVVICACQLWSDNARWAHKAKVSERGTAQLAAALENMPRQTLVLVWFPPDTPYMSRWAEILPYALQEPFRRADLYSPARLIEPFETYCCPLPQWWGKTRGVLAAELAGPADEPVEVELFAWDERTTSFLRRKRALPKELLRAIIIDSLAGPAETTNTIEQANHLVDALARLVLETP